MQHKLPFRLSGCCSFFFFFFFSKENFTLGIHRKTVFIFTVSCVMNSKREMSSVYIWNRSKMSGWVKSASRRVKENTSVERSLVAAAPTMTLVHLSHFLCVSVRHAIPSLVDLLVLNKFHEDISPTTYHFKGDFVWSDFVSWGFSTRTRFWFKNAEGFWCTF